MRRPTFWFVVFLVSLPLVFAGCAELDATAARTALDELKQARAAATQAAAALPTDDPLRKRLEQTITQIDAKLPAVDAVVRSLEKGGPVSSLPTDLGGAFGPYGYIAGLAGAFLWGAIERHGKRKQVEIGKQLVQSVEAALPQKTAEQKAALAGVQDVKTKAFVDAVKGR